MKTPEWKIIRHLPKHLNKGAVERAVHSFVKDTAKYSPGVEPTGFFNSTIQDIAKACVLTHDGVGGDFWAAIGDDGEIYAYALASIVMAIDNRPTYWVTQGWIHTNYRHEYLKKGWKELEKHARANLCRHLINVTDRHAGAYLRMLGKDWHRYTTILKKDLEEENGNK